jgi:hypothetical protein
LIAQYQSIIATPIASPQISRLSIYEEFEMFQYLMLAPRIAFTPLRSNGCGRPERESAIRYAAGLLVKISLKPPGTPCTSTGNLIRSLFARGAAVAFRPMIRKRTER